MPVALIAPTVSATNSADFTVTATAPVNIGLYVAAGGGLSGEVVVSIERKNPSATYGSTGLSISGSQTNMVVTAPGVYRAVKPATTLAVGVQTD